jgi:hypothetical protein
MITTDITGTYDYEKTEAIDAANYILESLYDGDITPATLPEALLNERLHWKKHLPDTFNDFDTHFNAQIIAGLPEAIAGYKLTTKED